MSVAQKPSQAGDTRMTLARNVWHRAFVGNRDFPRLALVALLLAGAVGSASAQEGNIPKHEGSEPAPTGTRPPWRNHAAFFTGITIDDGEAGFTLGLDYERRFHRWYGAGLTTEAVLGPGRDIVVGPTFFLHPVGEFRLGLTAAGEHVDGEWVFLFRIGMDYDFELRPDWTIGPSFGLDFARGRRIVVLGASLGRIF